MAEDIWRRLWQAMRARNIYLVGVSIPLIYFTFNHPLIGMSQQMVTGYALLYLLSMFLILRDKGDNPTYNGGLFHWEQKPTVLTMAANYSVALVGSILIFSIIRGLSHQTAALPREMIFSLFLQQALIVTPVETAVFDVIIPQHIHHVLGGSKWGGILTVVISQMAFGFMHATAYGGNVLQIIFAMLFGVVLLFTAIRFRPETAQAVHLGYNMVVLGIIGW